MAITYPFPNYQAFTAFTPVVPNLYWDCYTQEERIKKLCMEIVKLTAYSNTLVDTVNSQYEEITEMRTSFDEIAKEIIETDPIVAQKLTDAVQSWADGKYTGRTYADYDSRSGIFEEE